MLQAPPGAGKPDCHSAARTWLTGVLVVVAVLAALSFASAVCVPVVMAIFVAAILRAPVRGVMRLGLNQAIATTLVFLIFFGILFGLSTTLYRPAATWVSELPTIVSRVESKLTPVRLALRRADRAAQKLEDATDLSPRNASPVEIEQPSLLDLVFRHSRILVAQLCIVGLLSFFMLMTPQPVLPPRFLAIFGGAGRKLKVSLREIEAQLSVFMGLMALTNLSVGILTGVAMYVCGMPNPLLWAAVATFFSFIPYVGPIAATALIAGAAFVTFNDWQAILIPPAAFLVLHLIAVEIAMPLLQGKILTLHPVTIFMAVLFWGWMWGLAGAFLAVPITVACTIAGRKLLFSEHAALAWSGSPGSDDMLAASFAEHETALL